MGGNAMLYYFLPHYFRTGISKWTVHSTPSSTLASSFRLERSLPPRVSLYSISKLSDGQEYFAMVRPKLEALPHRHGQRIRRQLFGHHPGAHLGTRRRVCIGPLFRVDVQSHTNKTHGHFMGDQLHVGDHRDSFCPSSTQLHRMLVGRFGTRRASMQRFWHLVRTEDLSNIRDERVQMGEHKRHTLDNRKN